MLINANYRHSLSRTSITAIYCWHAMATYCSIIPLRHFNYVKNIMDQYVAMACQQYIAVVEVRI